MTNKTKYCRNTGEQINFLMLEITNDCKKKKTKKIQTKIKHCVYNTHTVVNIAKHLFVDVIM